MVVPAAPRWRYTGDGWLLRVIAARPQPPLPAPLLLLCGCCCCVSVRRAGCGEVDPGGGASHARGHPHRPQRINQEDGQPRAGRVPRRQHLGGGHDLGRLVGLEVQPSKQRPHALVHRLCSLRHAACALHQLRHSCPHQRPPRVSWLVEAGVGQHVVQEQRPRHLARPGLRGARGQGQVGVGRQLVAAHARTVRMGHVSLQESHASALLVGL
mmetsp:Transcript_4187/g.10467  ORF Transcript_4187/g.10467 Transcript_4187/m.10467 type:complete len:212 (-) Transcript_4187:480-1115(-)